MRFHKIYIQQNILCLIIFTLILATCMVLYPGGAHFNNSADHYLFFENFISHLGKTSTSSGNDNYTNSILFKGGVYLISISFALLFLFQPLVFKTHAPSFRLSMFSSALALSSALAFIGIGYYSADPSTLQIHLAFVKTSFYLFFISCLTQTLAIRLHPKLPKTMFYNALVFSLGLLSYNLLIEFGPRPNTDIISLLVQVTAQKVIAILFILSFIIQGCTLLRVLKK